MKEVSLIKSLKVFIYKRANVLLKSDFFGLLDKDSLS